MKGELALAFGELLRKLWAPGRTPIAPRPFKTKLVRFAPQFSGHNQHDSQVCSITEISPSNFYDVVCGNIYFIIFFRSFWLFFLMVFMKT